MADSDISKMCIFKIVQRSKYLFKHFGKDQLKLNALQYGCCHGKWNKIAATLPFETTPTFQSFIEEYNVMTFTDANHWNDIDVSLKPKQANDLLKNYQPKAEVTFINSIKNAFKETVGCTVSDVNDANGKKIKCVEYTELIKNKIDNKENQNQIGNKQNKNEFKSPLLQLPNLDNIPIDSNKPLLKLPKLNKIQTKPIVGIDNHSLYPYDTIQNKNVNIVNEPLFSDVENNPSKYQSKLTLNDYKENDNITHGFYTNANYSQKRVERKKHKFNRKPLRRPIIPTYVTVFDLPDFSDNESNCVANGYTKKLDRKGDMITQRVYSNRYKLNKYESNQ